MIYLFILIMSGVGAFLYRLRGASWACREVIPRPLPQIWFALPYAVISPGGIAAYLVVLFITTLAVCTGHGSFQDLGTWTGAKLGKPEKLEFIIKWLRGRIPLYWYDALGLAVTGLAVTLPAGIFTLNPFIALSGALKAPAYMIAKLLGWGTAGGEWLTGAFLFAALFAAVTL